MAGIESKATNARQRARAALVDEMERQKKRETALADVFRSLDSLDEAKRNTGLGLSVLIELGETRQGVAKLTGLKPGEIKQFLELAESKEPTKSDVESAPSGDQSEGPAPSDKSSE